MKKPQEGAVEMMRRIRDAHYERFKDRPVEERIAYYRERARLFEAKVRQDEAEQGAA